jgi:hypothetical protein
MQSFLKVKKNIPSRKKIKTTHDKILTASSKSNLSQAQVDTKVSKPIKPTVEEDQDPIRTVASVHDENRVLERIPSADESVVPRLAKQDKVITQVSEIVEHPKKRKSIASEDEVDLLPPKLLSSSKNIFKTATEPAYVRFKHLTVSKTELPLPKEYENLFVLFNALETIVNYLRSRDTIPIFHKIQKPIENQSGKNFNLDHLAKIVYIYPEAYKLSATICMIKDQRVPSVSIELKNDILKEEFVKNLSRDSQPLIQGPKLSKMKSIGEDRDMLESVQKFVKQIPVRRLEFKKLLMANLTKLHEVFGI